MKFKTFLTGGIIFFVVGCLGLLCPLLLSNAIINATLLIAVGMIGILRFFVVNDQLFTMLAVLITVLLILVWIFLFSFTSSITTTESVVSVMAR